jgi:hypothetical protein
MLIPEHAQQPHPQCWRGTMMGRDFNAAVDGRKRPGILYFQLKLPLQG